MNLYLYQPQYAFNYMNREVFWLPYSIGSLWAYAIQFEDIKENWTLKELGFKRDNITDVVARMESPNLVGLSVYIWNRNYCIALGEAIKKRWPKCIIMIGGPMVNSSWTKHLWVDSIILNEGERCFVEVLRTVAKKQELDLFYKMERMDTLSGVPSPYVAGIFDDLVKKYPDYYWNVTLETNRGCPYQCTFCDWGGLIASKMKKFDMHRIEDELKWIVQQKVGSIFIADSNLGIFFERDKKIARMVRQAADKLGVDYIASNFLKNSDERLLEIADILGDTTKGLTFSVQSMNPETLKVIKRHNLSTSDAKHLFELSARKKIQFYTELMLGLPLETKESWTNGINELLEMGQHNRITIIPVVPLENTELGDVQKGPYGIETVEVLDGLRFVDKTSGDVQETWPWVCATNTMTREEMVDCWLYGWMITNFHTTSGYSMLLSKYCRNVLNISYRQFYDEMWRRLNDETADSIVHQQFRLVKRVTTEIYTKGYSTDPEVGPHNHMDYSSKIFYKHFNETHEFCRQVAETFGTIDPGVVEIQQRFLVNNYYETPHQTSTSVDIDTWERSANIYKITQQDLNLDSTYNSFSTLEKKGKKLLTNITRVCE